MTLVKVFPYEPYAIRDNNYGKNYTYTSEQQ